MEVEPIKIFGAELIDASFSVGWGAQSSTCQANIVFEKDGPLTGQDFSRNFPDMGTCVGIAIGDLKFAGLFQRYSQQRSLDGYKYNIVIESPSRALDGVHVILDSFQGSNYSGMGTFTNQVSNVWNPFAIKENYNFGGLFGLSDVNSLGFPGAECLALLEDISKGKYAFGGKIRYGNTEFELDLSEVRKMLASVPNSHMYRIKGPSQTISAILDDVCSLLMHDYVVTVEPIDGKIETGIITNAKIKIKVIDKSTPPDSGVIKRIANKYEAEEKLISGDIGKELNDAVTQKVVVGGPASRYYAANKLAMTPIWGRTKSLFPEYSEMIILDNGQAYPPDIMEVRCAMHSFDSWILYHIIRRYLGKKNPIIDKYANALFTNVRIDDFVIRRIATGKISAIDFMDSTFKYAQQKNQITVGKFMYEDLESIHNSIKSAGEEYWGRKFFITLPQEPGGIANNLKFVMTDFQYINSWEVSDSAWVENSGFRDVSFYDGEGRLKPTASWVFNKNNYDYTNLGNGYSFTSSGMIASVVNIEKDIIWRNGSPTCVAEVQAVQSIDQYTTQTNGLAWLLNIYFGYSLQQLLPLFALTAESGTTNYGIAPGRAMPMQIGVPQQSTRYRWGPWWNYKSKNGKAEFILEDSLTPETYGGVGNMNDVGATYAAVINAEVSGRETGTIETYGLPSSGLAERFLASGPYVTSMSVNYNVSGITTSYSFNTWTPEFGKLAKYNSDRFATMNKNAIAFLQANRSKMEKRPFTAPPYKDTYFGKGMKNLFALNAGISFPVANIAQDDDPKKKDEEQEENGEAAAAAAPNGNNATVPVDLNGVDNKKRTIVNCGSPQNQVGVLSRDFKNSYGCSMEQIFTPVGTRDVKSSTVKGPELQKSDADANFKAPNSDNYDPYFAKENDFTLALHGEDFSANLDMNLNNQNSKPSIVRAMGLRGPLLLSGWGMGLDGKAAPYNSNGDVSDRFNHIAEIGKKRHLWKTGPIDLRWDEERKTWGSGFDFVEGFLAEDLPSAASFEEPEQFILNILRSSHFIEKNGAKLDNKLVESGETIVGLNRDTSLSLKKGTYVLCIRINYEWRIASYSC
jgi:hypothetical protein